eukprot:CAMPEP_0171080582 /NCGR_PEP_ID=MMETSP0766_2-20121228/15956_1 /TAXON_ID=439317 /ORGANISM="Gambierdiscus australes, Strain CAWD 149" /LENGTH=155 /DNA_ID=CAMNT_0011537829 /DNA_START=183 /DNA_END=648 /DNA_ORIENTATION=-
MSLDETALAMSLDSAPATNKVAILIAHAQGCCTMREHCGNDGLEIHHASHQGVRLLWVALSDVWSWHERAEEKTKSPPRMAASDRQGVQHKAVGRPTAGKKPAGAASRHRWSGQVNSSTSVSCECARKPETRGIRYRCGVNDERLFLSQSFSQSS